MYDRNIRIQVLHSNTSDNLCAASSVTIHCLHRRCVSIHGRFFYGRMGRIMAKWDGNLSPALDGSGAESRDVLLAMSHVGVLTLS